MPVRIGMNGSYGLGSFIRRKILLSHRRPVAPQSLSDDQREPGALAAKLRERVVICRPSRLPTSCGLRALVGATTTPPPPPPVRAGDRERATGSNQAPPHAHLLRLFGAHLVGPAESAVDCARGRSVMHRVSCVARCAELLLIFPSRSLVRLRAGGREGKLVTPPLGFVLWPPRTRLVA